MRLILASASPRRAELLGAAGFTFEVCAAEVDERVLPGERPRDYVRRLAIEKAAKAFEMVAGPTSRTNIPADDVLIIGADTAVIIDDEILGKPVDDAEAARMLRRLSERSHVVMTGLAIRGQAFNAAMVEETRVEVAALSDEQLAWYVGTGEGRDKAGAYAIQGLASRFIPRIDGSYTNVVGLPVARVVELIQAADERRRVLASGR